jgi:hypothetical protein
MLYEELNSLNINSSYVINNIHRKVLDCNREKNVAYIDDVAKKNYYKFHSKIEQYITDNIFSDSITLILDIHGHTHKHNYLELGYDISYEKLNKDVFEIYNSSLQNISNEKSLLAILGDIYRLKSNIIAVPNSNIDTPKEYFNGGYITEKYKLYPNTVVIQLEIPSLIRKNKNLRKEFCKVTSTIIKDYYSFLNYIYEKN